MISINKMTRFVADGTLELCLNVPEGSQSGRFLHRYTMPPGSDVEAHMAHVSNHLESMSKGRIPDEVVAQIRAVTDEVWTPEVIAAYQAAQEQQ